MSEQIISLIAEAENIGIRLDKFISEKRPDISRSYIQKLIDDERISIIPSRTVKASYKLKDGDKIQIILPEPEKLDIEPENIDIDIIYEDDDIIVIDKPQGMVVHPAAGNYTGTLVNALMYHCGSSLSTINGIERPGIVHRIDKDTSGLLVICKNDAAHRSLARQFEDHTINRIYSCIVYNHFDINKMSPVDYNDAFIRRTGNSDQFVSDETVDELLYLDGISHEQELAAHNIYSTLIAKSIARDKKDRKKMAIDPDGRNAITHIYLKENLKENYSYIKCKLETGRTHQIRVHLSYIKHPLLGDPVYGPKSCPFNLDGQVLHAGTLGFIHPGTNRYIEFRSELPEYFSKILRRLR